MSFSERNLIMAEKSEISKKQFIAEGISSICALISSVAALIAVIFTRCISINLFQSDSVTVYELTDIIDSYRRMISNIPFVDTKSLEKYFSDLDAVSMVFVALSIAMVVLLLIHIAFLVFGKGKWIKSPIVTATVLYIALIVAVNMFADKVNESVAEMNFGFISLSNVLTAESSMYYGLTALLTGVVSTFVYAYYKKKN